MANNHIRADHPDAQRIVEFYESMFQELQRHGIRAEVKVADTQLGMVLVKGPGRIRLRLTPKPEEHVVKWRRTIAAQVISYEGDVLHPFAYEDATTPADASVSRDALLARIEAAVIPPPLDLTVPAEEHDRAMWRRFITVYDTLLELLRIQGLFEGHTLLIPGSGIDAFPARVVPTIGIEREPLTDAALDLAARVTGQPRDIYATNFTMSPGPLSLRYHDVRTPHRTVLFKGMMDYVMEKQQARLEAYLADLQDIMRVGDRILFCNRGDLEASAIWLTQHGWQRRDDWLPAAEQARLDTALEFLQTDATNARERSMLNAHLTFFEMPEILVVYERVSVNQTTNAAPPAAGVSNSVSGTEHEKDDNSRTTSGTNADPDAPALSTVEGPPAGEEATSADAHVTKAVEDAMRSSNETQDDE